MARSVSLVPGALVLALSCTAQTGSVERLQSSQAHVEEQRSTSDTRAVDASELCVSGARLARTTGRSMRVDAGGMRAVVAGDHSAIAEVSFTYDGPSSRAVPLANGELRRQVGLKLRAADTCNVVYVMWHAEPTTGIVVSVKHNPGASTHAECGDRGYKVVPPESAADARLSPGERHRLRAELAGDALRVLADGAVVWTGKLPPEAFTFDGPAGVRTDNVAVDFELRVAEPARADARCPGE